MKLYTVVWSESAEREFIQLWLTSEHPAEVQAAADYLEKLLANNPTGIGRIYSSQSRTVENGRVKLLYRVLESDRIVRILVVKEL